MPVLVPSAVEGLACKMHKEIFMVARKDGTGYRKVSRAVRNTMRNAGTIRLEGVDGDEVANTVTYWYEKELM